MVLNYLSVRVVLILNPFLVYIDLTFVIECNRLFMVLLLIQSMVLTFKLIMVVLNKDALFINNIYPLIVMFLSTLITYLGTVIYYVTTGSGFLCLFFPFNVSILGPYIFSDLL